MDKDPIEGHTTGAGARGGTGRQRRHLPDELERLQREAAEREAQIADLGARLIEAYGRESRIFGALHGLTSEWERKLAGTDNLNAILWAGTAPTRFDPGETRIRVLLHTRDFTPAERLAWLKLLTCVPTPQVDRLHVRLDTLRENDRAEMNNLRVVGGPGCGKTWAITIYALRVNGAVPPGSSAVPILLLEAPDRGSGLVPMFREGLSRLGEPTSGGAEAIAARFYRKVAEHGVELLVIDEAGNLDTEPRRRAVRRLTNVLKIPIVAVSADEKWVGEDHLGRRFRPLHRFGPHVGSDLIELLATLEAYLPFQGRSDLFEGDRVVDGRHVPGPATFIAERTGGVIDLVSALVYRAARIAIANGHDAIAHADLEAGWANYMVVGAKDGEDNKR